MKITFIVLTLLISIYGISCTSNSDKSSNSDRIIITQPNVLYLDTLSCYYRYIKEYIKNDPDQRNSYLMAVYYSNAEYVTIKIAAFKPVNVLDFNFRIPSSYFRLDGRICYIMTGMDHISVPDKDYIRSIKINLNKERHFDSLPPAWEIIYDYDTCYYRESNLSLIPEATEEQFKRVKKFVKPER